MKKNQTTNAALAQKPANETPKYHLAEVPQHLRVRLLDLCFRRLYHDAMKLLEVHGFNDYSQDDLINFYNWAPTELPGVSEVGRGVPAEPSSPRDYDQPPPEQIDELRQRLTVVPADVLDRVHDVLKQDSIVAAASLLWKAGVGFGSAELYEYRKTLFPPNSMVDAYTSGSPVLRDEERENVRPGEPEKADPPTDNDRSADSLSASSATGNGSGIPNPEPQTANREPVVTNDGLTEARQRLLNLLSARANPPLPNPEPITADLRDPISGLVLLSDLRDLINRYVVLPEMAAETLALWVVHTYAFTLRQVTTYIGVVSPEKRCGKTTLLELLALLTHEAVPAANISPPALFRVIEKSSPTLLIDEADTFLQGRDEMAGILNAGYRKSNSYVVRVAEGKASKNGLAKYSCWCPKVMAAIGRLPDTLADRCIVITMQRKMPAEKCERLRKLDGTDYRQRCADFVREHSDAIANAQPDIPATLNDRAADIWEPLFAIADLAGGDWPELARQAALKLSGSVDDEITLIGYFLSDLRNYMRLKEVDRILSREIVTAFNPMHTRPWEDLRRGREINEYWLGGKMRELGIPPKSVRFGEGTGKGYLLRDVDAAFQRYVPKVEAPEGASKAATIESTIG